MRRSSEVLGHRSARPAAVAVDDPVPKLSCSEISLLPIHVAASTRPGLGASSPLHANCWCLGTGYGGRRRALELGTSVEIQQHRLDMRPHKSNACALLQRVDAVQRPRAADPVRASPTKPPPRPPADDRTGSSGNSSPPNRSDAGLDRHATPREIPPTKLATPAGPLRERDGAARPSRSPRGAGRPLRQVASGQPHPVAGVEPVVLLCQSRIDDRSRATRSPAYQTIRSQFPDPPRQTRCPMGVEERFPPAAGAFRTRRAGSLWHPPQTLNTARCCAADRLCDSAIHRVGRLTLMDRWTRAGSARTGVVREHPRDPRQSVGFGKPRVVVEEEDHGRRVAATGVATGGMPTLFGSEAADPAGSPVGTQPLPTTTMSVVTRSARGQTARLCSAQRVAGPGEQHHRVVG